MIQSWNAAAEHLFGYTAEQAVGRHISLVIPPERLAEEDQIIASLKAGNESSITKPSECAVTANESLFRSPSRRSKMSQETWSARRRSRATLPTQKRAESDRQMFVTFVENSTDFIGMCDLEGIPFFVNRAGLGNGRS